RPAAGDQLHRAGQRRARRRARRRPGGAVVLRSGAADRLRPATGARVVPLSPAVRRDDAAGPAAREPGYGGRTAPAGRRLVRPRGHARRRGTPRDAGPGLAVRVLAGGGTDGGGATAGTGGRLPTRPVVPQHARGGGYRRGRARTRDRRGRRGALPRRGPGVPASAPVGRARALAATGRSRARGPPGGRRPPDRPGSPG